MGMVGLASNSVCMQERVCVHLWLVAHNDSQVGHSPQHLDA